MSQPPQQPPRPPQQQPPQGMPPQQPGPVPPGFVPGMFPAGQPKKVVSSEAEKNEDRRTIIYSMIFIIVVLLVGFVAGFIDQAIHSNNPERNQNFFILNMEDLLLIIASMAPWTVLFFLISMAWIFIANRLFVKWNTALVWLMMKMMRLTARV